MISSCGLLPQAHLAQEFASQSAASRLPEGFYGPLYKKNPSESPELLQEIKLTSQEGGYEKYDVSFFSAENKLHNIFLVSEAACHDEASFMTCSIFSLNNAETGSRRWDESQALDECWN